MKLSQIGVATIGAVRGVVNGALQGYIEADGPQEEVIIGAVGQTIHESKEPGFNVGDTAVEAVRGVVDVVQKAGGDTVKATSDAVVAAFDDAEDVGEGAVEAVTQSLKSCVDGAKDIIAEIKSNIC